jgi:hypothetical protein
MAIKISKYLNVLTAGIPNPFYFAAHLTADNFFTA